MKLVLPKFLIKLTGNIYLSSNPFWISYKPTHHKVKGYEIREILKNIEIGDILLRRYDGYLNTYFTPGFWGHAALYVGLDKIIHAIGEGVVQEDILDFCRCDSVCVLRPDVNNELKNNAIEKAIIMKTDHIQYDYKFKSDDDTQVYCTELVDSCYKRLFKNDYTIIAGNSVLIPDSIYKSKECNLIIEFKH